MIKIIDWNWYTVNVVVRASTSNNSNNKKSDIEENNMQPVEYNGAYFVNG